MSFDLEQLREVAEKYAFHDASTHGVWPRLVWERRSDAPVARVDDAVEFLGKWKALRFKGGGRAFRRICSNWLRKNLTNLQRLQGRVLYSLAPEDFQHIFDISSSFGDCGAPPTTFGKALHFFLPETVMLWDQAIVRNTYKLPRTRRASSHTSASDGNYYTTSHATKPSTRYDNLRETMQE